MNTKLKQGLQKQDKALRVCTVLVQEITTSCNYSSQCRGFPLPILSGGMSIYYYKHMF